MAATEAKLTPFEPGIVARVAGGLRSFFGTGPRDFFGPGEAIPPAAPQSEAGRAFDYPTGFNAVSRPRAYEPVGFAELRALADSYDVLRLVIETRKDQMEALEWSIKRRGRAQLGEERNADDPRISAIEAFFRSPDRDHGWHGWLRALLEDLFVIDAPAIYKRRDRLGRLYALELIDGSTIKRLIDSEGRTPRPPFPAYQQIVKGLAAFDYTTDELIYAPRNVRTHKVYGLSPVEQIVMTVNIALRRAVSQLNYYTEGNVPEALIGVPKEWTPEQIRQFQIYWDSLMEGNLAVRRHARFVPGELRIQQVREPALKDQLDEWLARVVCYAFSVSPTPFIAQVNRATAESAHDQALEEGLAPLQNWIKHLLDRVIAAEFAAPDLEFAWVDDRTDDPLKTAQIADTYIKAGIKSIDEVRRELGLPPQSKAGVGQPATVPFPDAFGKYSPDQPRVPAGNPDGGQWTSEGGDTSGSRAGDGSGLPRTMRWTPGSTGSDALLKPVSGPPKGIPGGEISTSQETGNDIIEKPDPDLTEAEKVDVGNSDYYQRYFDPGDTEHYHSYKVQVPICHLDQPGCTAENVYRELLAHAAPGQDTPAKDGHETSVFMLGRVKQSIDKANYSVTNSTIPNEHLLDPGVVRRSVVATSRGIEIRTVGVGLGPLGTLNHFLGPLAFEEIDNEIQSKFSTDRKIPIP